jgi:hypothetical protein
MSLAGQQRNPDAFYLTKHPNATPTLYGLRFMEADTQMGGADSLGRVDGQSAAAVKEGQRKDQLWIDQRRAQLMAMNKDNVVFETARSRCGDRPPFGRGCTCAFSTGRLTRRCGPSCGNATWWPCSTAWCRIRAS